MEAVRRSLEARGLAPGPVEPQLARDADSGLFRRWRQLTLPVEQTRGLRLSAVEWVTAPELLPPAEAAGAEEALVVALDHALVHSADAGAVAALFSDVLGLRLALDREFAEWGLRLVFFRIGGVTLELVQPLAASDASPATGAREVAAVDRFGGLCWRVPDADAARARLLAAGLEPSPVRDGRKPGTRVLDLRDGTCGVPTLLLEAAPR